MFLTFFLLATPLRSARGISLTRIGFTDVDFRHDGSQSGFSAIADDDIVARGRNQKRRAARAKHRHRNKEVAIGNAGSGQQSRNADPRQQPALRPPSAGLPGDAAVRITRSEDITVLHCAFAALGSGGVRAAGSNARLVVKQSHFDTMLSGSAIALTGGGYNDGLHNFPHDNFILGNTIRHVGVLLSAAAGVLCSACANTIISNNSISRSSRWGVHVRSGPGPRGHIDTLGNAVDAVGIQIEGNTLVDCGQSSDDMGAISLIAYDGAAGQNGSVSRNCIVNVGISAAKVARKARREYSDLHHRRRRTLGQRGVPPKLTPEEYAKMEIGKTQNERSMGIYLDNWSSQWDVSNNVVLGEMGWRVFLHWGGDNSIRGNIFSIFNQNENEDNTTESLAAAYGVEDGDGGHGRGVIRLGVIDRRDPAFSEGGNVISDNFIISNVCRTPSRCIFVDISGGETEEARAFVAHTGANRIATTASSSREVSNDTQWYRSGFEEISVVKFEDKTAGVSQQMRPRERCERALAFRRLSSLGPAAASAEMHAACSAAIAGGAPGDGGAGDVQRVRPPSVWY